jgi:hypothetical protein
MRGCCGSVFEVSDVMRDVMRESKGSGLGDVLRVLDLRPGKCAADLVQWRFLIQRDAHRNRSVLLKRYKILDRWRWCVLTMADRFNLQWMMLVLWWSSSAS